MGKTTIEWTDYTFNPWIGCAKVSAGCKNCYAETLMDTRWGKVRWGAGQPRQRTTPAYWRQPDKWNRDAQLAGVRRRVFCASLADVFDEEVDDAWRAELFVMIRNTPALDWLVLTKRVDKMLDYLGKITAGYPIPNLWLGVSVEDQKTAYERIPALLMVDDISVRFVSYEPALEAVKFYQYLPNGVWKRHVDWIIVGGESGPHARPFHVQWARSAVIQCRTQMAACFVKQLGRRPRMNYYDEFREEWENITSSDWPDPIGWSERDGQPPLSAEVELPLRDAKGGDPDEWPEEIRVREFPKSVDIHTSA